MKFPKGRIFGRSSLENLPIFFFQEQAFHKPFLETKFNGLNDTVLYEHIQQWLNICEMFAGCY